MRKIRCLPVLGILFLLAGTIRAAEVPATAPAEVPAFLDSGLTADQVRQRPWLDYVRECVDLLIARGTDRYGSKRRPILVSIIDVRDQACPSDPLPLDEAVRVGRRGRRAPAGANLYLDQQTIRVMSRLTDMTGKNIYKDFVRLSTGHYMNELVDDQGLFWWGFHRHYDVFADTMEGHMGDWHEIHFMQAAWPVLWEIDPKAVTREIEACWQWHVIDKKTGEINRHADGKPGCDFAFTGGELIYAFSFMYKKTGEDKWLDRARLLSDYYWNARDSETNLVPTRPNAGKGRFDGEHFDTSTVGQFCQRLLAASSLTDDDSFRRRAVAYLKAYAKLGWSDQHQAYWGCLKTDGTPEPGPRVLGGYEQYEPRGPIDLWQPYVAGYEKPIYAAQTYAYAARMTGDPQLIEAAQRWAECIERELPPRRAEKHSWYGWYAEQWAPHGTYADLYGRTVSFMLQMYQLTGQDKYLELARTTADEAIVQLYYKGLFRGHHCKPYYEAMDGVGYLLTALLQLHELDTGKDPAAIDFGNW